MGGRSKMGNKLRRIITSKATLVLGLRPCPMEKAFPGKKAREEKENMKKSLDVKAVEKNKHGLSKWSSLGAKVQEGSNNKVAPTGAQRSLKKLVPDTSDLMQAVDDMITLDSESNMEFLWQYMATIMDRVFLYIHIFVSFLVVIIFMTAL